MEVGKGLNDFYYAVYDEENETYSEPNRVKEIQTITEIIPSSIPRMNGKSYEGTLYTKNLKAMTPTMRRYFKRVRIGNVLYL
ncbi:hypothetical protein [Oceanobacillus kimchii]|uniref:hypothetical protein n=1 Tax=Oceanobacillus kimchii TaxID=746691 RepID=UPI000348576E|nr:hypothetical protein [Oceanobacillus kimchii]